MIEIFFVILIMFLPFFVGKTIFMFDFYGLKRFFTKSNKGYIKENKE